MKTIGILVDGLLELMQFAIWVAVTGFSLVYILQMAGCVPK